MSWKTVNLNLIAKALGELSFEQIIVPVQLSENLYKVKLQSGAEYTFIAWKSIWDHLRVTPSSIKKNKSQDIDAGQFFIDAQIDLGMTDIVLSNFLEEMQNSLYSDLAVLERQQNITAIEMTDWTGEKIQTLLNGHPKILLGKGRVGWGASELNDFAPEMCKSVRLHWIAVKKASLIFSIDDTLDSELLLKESLDREELMRFKAHLKTIDLEFENFYYLPVHPWQWDRFIKIQYLALQASGEIVSLGIFGDDYLPQISIRTLSNISRPKNVDIKLPLTILNTSAIRGIPSRYISIGTSLSRHMMAICQEDKLLAESNTSILTEVAGMSVEHPLYKQVKNSPYRYKELLGAVWRESSAAKIQENESAIITGSLFFQDLEGHSLVGAYIKRSGLGPEEWLKNYFTVVVIPLYHLQLKYGVGLVAHGQNIILRLRNFKPFGMILKDFQGDLRLSQESILLVDESFKEVAEKLDKLPANHLIHDLLTGHLSTVLRFVSGVMEESEDFKELDFYKILSDVINDYNQKHNVPSELNFLNKTIHRIQVNKVRFKIGYGDSSERPKPMVGEDLQNPVYLGLKHGEAMNE